MLNHVNNLQYNDAYALISLITCNYWPYNIIINGLLLLICIYFSGKINLHTKVQFSVIRNNEK